MKRILVALDRSESARIVLERAVQLARDTGAKLRVLRAVPLPPAPPPPVAGVLRQDGRAAVIASAQASLRKLEGAIPEAMRDGLVLELGSAANAICAAADAYDADVVVIGAHRIGAVHRALGTTATKVVNALERPVLVVRSPASSAAAGAEAARFEGHDKHPLLETATLAGAAGGAIAGVLAGVPGVVAGSMLGTALGMLAGEKLDEASSHRESTQISAAPARTDAHGRPLRAGEVMRRDHELLDELYRELIASYRAGEWSDVAAQWSVFEPALRMHMEAEERDIFPAFRGVYPRETDALLAEHAALRERLGTLGMLLELHAVPQRDAEDFVARLRAHSAREVTLLYPWMDEAIGVDAVHGVSSAA